MNIKENVLKGKYTNYLALGVLILGGGYLVYKGEATLAELSAFVVTVGGFVLFGEK